MCIWIWVLLATLLAPASARAGQKVDVEESSDPRLSTPWRGVSGSANVRLPETISGESVAFDRLAVMGDYSTAVISTATTTTVKSGVGVLRSCQVLGGTLGAITVYDNTAASGTVIAPAFTPTATVPGTQILPDIRFSVGLTIVTAAATILQCSFL